MVLCGGECAEDITEHLRTELAHVKGFDYIFDYDNLFIPTDKYDSKRSYKHADGYFPGIASIGNFPVYIEKPQWQQQQLGSKNTR